MEGRNHFADLRSFGTGLSATLCFGFPVGTLSRVLGGQGLFCPALSLLLRSCEASGHAACSLSLRVLRRKDTRAASRGFLREHPLDLLAGEKPGNYSDSITWLFDVNLTRPVISSVRQKGISYF